MTKYLIETVKGKKQRIWSSGRNRGLKELSERIGDIVPYIERSLEVKRKIRVLEVGCGYGKTLLELRKKYGDRVQTYGINYEDDWDINLIRLFGLDQKLFSKNDIDKNLPHLSIADAGKRIPYQSDYFDFIFSQATTQYISDKAHFLEEVNRVLAKKGIAILEMQNSKSPLGYENIFEIWKSKEKNEKPTLFNDFIKKYNNIQVYKSSKSSGWSVIILKKSKHFRLNLKLIYSIDLHKINSEWWGTKSIYIIK